MNSESSATVCEVFAAALEDMIDEGSGAGTGLQ
jgi:hypothetical protein